MDDRNHQTFRHGAGLRSSAPQMGRRTYFRMARSLSQAGKGFRSDNRQRRCLGVRCAHPNPHAATRKSLKSNAIIMSQTLMPRGPKGEKRPADVIGAAVMVGRIATGEIEEGAGAPPDDGKDPAAVALGRKGGAARAAGMTAKRRKEIAKKAAQKR